MDKRESGSDINGSPKKKKLKKKTKKHPVVSSKLKALVDDFIKSAEDGTTNENELNKNEECTINEDGNAQITESNVISNEKDLKGVSNKNSGKNISENDEKYPVVFIGNVPLSIKTKSDLIKKLNLDPKIVKSVHFRSLPVDPKFASNKKVGIIKQKFTDAKDTQNAYVKLVSEEYLCDILNKNTIEVDGKHLFINATSPNSFSKFSRKKTVFVGRLPPSTNEDELFNLFSNVSPVKSVRIIRDPKTLKSKGFGFVEFDTRIAVPEAIDNFNNTQFKGYTLNVMKSFDETTSKAMKNPMNKSRFRGKSKNMKKVSKDGSKRK
ncbi:RNA recognition motif domain-containing protein [Theileria equi strain WA]|uniref:RNA recognition motif domain-containing protein n=1 Tax=Theileria equi strain WA TaxID=1537102 RepID=L0B3I3_THEEQ|nr:RNA recognition motif domain-containing protein [Theileria equi strain WA]AFZ81679.1 RNA recognition motif domain-containing protein [Theileria equi strain WA]|eukprot:XP_004831345.1 RNA recognition motif domain-containing protein [Theileria equi strain WA]